jgi:hypothetical protein
MGSCSPSRALSPTIHFPAVEAPLSHRDCSYKLVGLGLLHREQNQFDVQSLRLEVTHVVFPRGRHPRTPAKEQKNELGKARSSSLVFKSASLYKSTIIGCFENIARLISLTFA